LISFKDEVLDHLDSSLTKNKDELKLNQLKDKKDELKELKDINKEESPTKESMFLNFKDLKAKMYHKAAKSKIS